MGQFDGQVVYITGIARGQGRNHAIRFAREGASVIGCDICAPVTDSVGYPASTPDDLAETVRLVEAEGGQILARRVDVRDLEGQKQLVADGVARFGGRLDHIIANAGICNWGKVWEIDEDQWQDTIDTNLTGTWKTLRAAIPHMLEADNGGSIIIISSVAGLKAMPVQAPYSASKHGIVGLAQTAAKELGEHRIRVNTVHPYGVNTTMISEDPGAIEVFSNMPQFAPHFVPILIHKAPAATLDDISDTILFLSSEQASTITASEFTVDMGATKV